MNGLAGILTHSGTCRAIPETEYYFGFLPRLSELLSLASTRLSKILSRTLPRLSELFRRGFPESLRTPETFRNATPECHVRNYCNNYIHRDSPEQVSPELITYDSPEQVSSEIMTYNTPGFSRTSLFRAYGITQMNTPGFSRTSLSRASMTSKSST